MNKRMGSHGFRPAKGSSYTGPGEYLTITPEKDPSIVARHVERYETAVALVTNQRGLGGRWLDCACGTGYGSKAVLDVGEEYWGVDRNAQAIAAARQSYGVGTKTGARFMQVDIRAVRRWLPGLGPFDAILSIETLEHLPCELQALWIAVAARNLTADGVMIVACPLGQDVKSEYNRYHVFEPTLCTLGLLLGSAFERVSIKTQTYVDTADHGAVQAMAVCLRPKAKDDD